MVSLQLPQLFVDLQPLLLYLNNIFALAIGPQHHSVRLLISFPILVLLVAQSLHREWNGGWGYHYALNVLVVGLGFTWVDWILLASPDKQAWGKIRYLKQKDGAVVAKKEDSPPKGFLKRAWWGTRLVTTFRYVGWSCQVKGVNMEVGADYPRWLFVVRKTLRAAVFYLGRDILASYLAACPHGSWIDIAHLKPAVGFAGYPFWHRFKFVWVHIILGFVSLEMGNALCGAVSVATGLVNPRDCPSQFGDWKDLVSVRKAWSSVWHQQVRRICSAPGTYIVRDVLQLRKGSFASKYIQLFSTFAVSGIMHAGGSMLIHRSWEDDGAMVAFLLQATIILVEDHVIDFGKRLGIKGSPFWRLVGFVWTILALGISLEAWVGSQVRQGIWVQARERDLFAIGPKI